MTAGIFCAIDASSLEDATAMARRLSGLDIDLKLGLEFFVSEGPQGVQRLCAAARPGAKLFLDLKLHDIPNTVAGAVRAATACGADFITVHAAGGKEMLRAAVHAATDAAEKQNRPPPRLLGVTVLTHLDEIDLAETGVAGTTAEQALKLAGLCAEAGLAGVVCSPHEVTLLRGHLPSDFTLVVPGIRPAGTAAGDQKRILTPAAAAALGADYLVIGRPITQAVDPARAASDILSSLQARAA